MNLRGIYKNNFTMNNTDVLYLWLADFIFIIGVLLLIVGLCFCFIPKSVFKTAKKMNKWVVTESIFDYLNKPRYNEVYFYRHHRVFGLIIVLVSTTCFYFLTFYIGIENMTNSLVKLAENEFEKWIFVILYYQLISAMILSILIGTIIIIRPSVLKKIESWANKWVDTDGPLSVLDSQKDLPDRVLPGNPRIFGVFVIVGALYMIWNTFPL